MKLKIKENAKKQIALFSILAVVAVGGSTAATYAFLTSTDNATNRIQIADVKTSITEDFTPVKPEPGKSMTKKPSIKNESNVDVFVRAEVKFSNSDMEALCEPLEINPNWTKASDGYYYYGKALKKGQTSEPIFTTVKYKSDASETDFEDAGALDILVYSEAVQAYGASDAQSAFAAY